MSISTLVVRPSQNAHLLKDVYSILDSRIQYMEYQSFNQLKSCISSKKSEPDSEANHTDENNLMSNYYRMLHFAQDQMKGIQMLQVLRSWLSLDNIDLILNLLHNDRYLNYSVHRLEQLVKVERVS